MLCIVTRAFGDAAHPHSPGEIVDTTTWPWLNRHGLISRRYLAPIPPRAGSFLTAPEVKPGKKEHSHG